MGLQIRVRRLLERVGRPHDCDLPLEQVVVVDEARRETVHRALRELCMYEMQLSALFKT